MKKTIIVAAVLMLLAGCGGTNTTDTGDKGHASKYDPYNPVQNHDPKTGDTTVKENHNSIPGQGQETFKTATEVRLLDLPGSPVWIKDKYFNVLFGASDKDGGKKLLDMLTKEKVEMIDYVFIPSTNPETFEGLAQLVGQKKLHISKIGIISATGSQALRNIAKLVQDNMITTENLSAGAKWQLNDMMFDVLYPMSADVSSDTGAVNTCVVRISKGNWSAILTGEMTEEIGQKLIERGKLSPTSVVIATNGAPSGSLSRDFLDAVKADRIVAGKRTADFRSSVSGKDSVKNSGAIAITVKSDEEKQQ